jgi:hypothetical protein
MAKYKPDDIVYVISHGHAWLPKGSKCIVVDDMNNDPFQINVRRENDTGVINIEHCKIATVQEMRKLKLKEWFKEENN